MTIMPIWKAAKARRPQPRNQGGQGKLWDAADKTNIRELRDLTAHTARITAAVFLPSAQRLLTASGDGTVAHWDVATGQEQDDLRLRHSRGKTITSLALTSDGRYALTSCDDGKVRLWDVGRAARGLSGGTGRPGPVK